MFARIPLIEVQKALESYVPTWLRSEIRVVPGSDAINLVWPATSSWVVITSEIGGRLMWNEYEVNSRREKILLDLYDLKCHFQNWLNLGIGIQPNFHSHKGAGIGV